jgi:predicted dehydrogenase
MTALRQKRVAIIGSEESATAYRDVLSSFPELMLDPAGAVEELLEGTVLADLALLCTAPARHLHEIDPLLRAGVDVLVKAPLALTQSEAIGIIERAERLARTVVTAAPLRVFDAVQKAGKLIEAGRIGRLTSIEITLSKKSASRPRGHRDSRVPVAGAWMDSGPDSLDLVEILAGPVERIRMLESKRRQGGSVEDEVLVDTEHGWGAVSRIRVSWNHEIPAPLARCRGECGEILIGWPQSLLCTADEKQAFAGAYDRREISRAVLEGFLGERMRPEPREDHGDQTLSWIEAGYRSLQNGRWEIA